MANENSLIIKINGSAKDFLDELEKVKKSTKDLDKVLTQSAKVAAAAFVGLSAVVVSTTKAYADYEKALVGVGKTTNIEGKSLENFGKEFKKLSSEIPISTNELLGIAQAAGQLGVKGEENLLKFTKTVAKLGVATDLTGEEAATSLTRILNVTGEGIETIDTFGAVIVELGNNFAATESEIVRMATEVSRSTAIFGVTSAQAAAMGTALKSVGVQAQVGGSAVGRAFRAIDEAVRNGGKNLENLAKLTGKTGEQLKETFQEDSALVFQDFIEGLGRVNASGGSVTATLASFGLQGDEILKVLPVLAKESKLVGQAFESAAGQVKNATALNNEAEKAFATLASEGQRVSNNFDNLKTTIGEALAPTITSLLINVNKLLKGLSEMNDETKESIASFLKWGTIIAGGIAAMAAFALGAIKISGMLTAVITAFGGGALAAGSFWAVVTGPIGIAVAGLAALSIGIYKVVEAANSAPPSTLEEINKELERMKKIRSQLDRPLQLGGDPAEVAKLDKAIEKLDELRAAKIRASKDFGTGSLLLETNVQKGPNLGQDAFGLPKDQVIANPVLATIDEANKAEDAYQKKKDERRKAELAGIEFEAQERIAKLKEQNSKLAAINAAAGSAETEQERALFIRRAEIENEFAEARKIKSVEERAEALTGLQLQHEQELAAITQQGELLALDRAERQAQKDEFNALVREAEIANAELISAEDQERLAATLQTEDDIKSAAATKEAEAEIARRNKYLKTTKEYNESVAKLDQIAANEKVQAAGNLADNLLRQAQAAGDKNSALVKAAALTRIAIDTPAAASSNYKYAAALGGPVAGAIAAGLAFAFGAKQAETVLAANQGGLVPSFAGAAGRDSVPAMLTPNELVVPTQNFDEVIDGVAARRGYTMDQSQDSNRGTVTVILEPTGDFIGMIEQKIIETQIQNTNVG